MDGAPIGIMVLGLDLRVLRLNDRASQMFDLDEKRAHGEQFQDVSPHVFGKIGDLLVDLSNGGPPRLAKEISTPTTDSDDERQFLGYYYPLMSENGTRIGIGCMFTEITRQRQAEGALELSRTEQRIVMGDVLRAEGAERSRLAFELHDDTIQVLWALHLQLDAMIPAAADVDPVLATRVTEARDMLAAVTERTRNLMFELHPTVLKEKGLDAAITILADQTGSIMGAEWSTSGLGVRYGPALEDLAFRIVREALANVRKHSRASAFHVRMSEAAGCVRGVVEDNGRGFDRNAVAADPAHLGVPGMAERARLCGGEITITSRPGSGVLVDFSLPMDLAAAGWHRRASS